MPETAAATLIAAIIALTGVMVAQAVVIWLAIVAGRRWRREQSLSVVRWAAELAVGGAERGSRQALGVATLIALGKSPLFHRKDQLILDAALAVAVQGADEQTIDAYTPEGQLHPAEEVENDDEPGRA